MKQAKDIEKLFQEAFKSYEADPGANAWNSIKSKLPQTEAASASAQSTAAASASGSSALTTAVVALTITGLAVGGYFFFDNKAASKKEKIKEKTEQSTPQIEISQNTEKEVSSKLKAENSDENKESSQSKIALEENKATNTNSSKDQKVIKEYDTSNEPKQESEPSDTRITSTADQKDNSNPEIDVEELLNEIAVEENSVSTEEKQGTNSESSEIQEDSNPTKTAAAEIHDSKSGESISNQETKLKTPKIDMPNTFTPNGDGRNDYFSIIDTEIEDLEVTIYSRTNRIVAQWKGKYGKWDGNMPDGTPAPEGVYFYQINFFEEGKVFAPARNSVTLER